MVPNDSDKLADEALAAVGLALAAEMQPRYRGLVSLYYRDLRDALETSSKLTMPPAAGGLGLDDAAAGRLMEKLKEGIRAMRAPLVAKAAEARASFVGAMTERRLQETAVSDAKDQSSRDDLYARITERVAGPKGKAPVAPPKPAVTRVIPVIDVSRPKAESRKPKAESDSQAGEGSKAFPSVLERAIPWNALPSPDAVAPTKQSAPPAPAPRTTDDGLRTRPAPIMPMASPAEGGRPSVTDVVAPPKLVGPTEELRQMGLADFRRLSRDPREACLKVKDKVDLLAERGFESKNQAVVAWQESGVNKLYLEMLRSSLEGTPVTEVIAKREHDGTPVLTKVEFDAIMDLNRKLRFG